MSLPDTVDPHNAPFPPAPLPREPDPLHTVVVLGGAHSIQAKLKAVNPRCEFIVVGIEAHKRAMGGKPWAE